MDLEKNIKKRLTGNLVLGIIVIALLSLVYLIDKVFQLGLIK